MRRTIAAGTAGKKSSVVYYDGGCRFCSVLVWWLSQADVFRRDSRKRVVWTPYQALAGPPPGLSWEDLRRAAYLVDGESGRLHEGYHAFRTLALRLPLLFQLAPLLWLPGMGRVVYRWVAGNHHGIFGCRAN